MGMSREEYDQIDQIGGDMLSKAMAEREGGSQADYRYSDDEVIDRNYQAMRTFAADFPKDGMKAKKAFDAWERGYGVKQRRIAKANKGKGTADIVLPSTGSGNATPAPAVPVVPVVASTPVESAPVVPTTEPAPAPAPEKEEPGFFSKTFNDIFGDDDHDKKLDSTEPSPLEKKAAEKIDWKVKAKELDDKVKGKGIETLTIDDLFGPHGGSTMALGGDAGGGGFGGVTPTEQELKDIPPELVAKLRGGFDANGEPLENPVLRDRRGLPIIQDGDFVYQSSVEGLAALSKEGKKYNVQQLRNGPLTDQEVEFDTKEAMKLLPKGSKLLENGQVLLSDGRVVKRKEK